MGLLDDAIRDHLELKRLSGADPALLDREEKEALDPAPAAEDAEFFDDVQGVEDVSTTEADRETTSGSPPAMTPVAMREGGSGIDSAPDRTPPDASGSDGAGVAQETVELDMGAVLGEHEDVPPAHSSHGMPTSETQQTGVAPESADERSVGVGDAE